MVAAVPVPGRKPSVRELFDQHNNPVVLPWERPHRVIRPIDEYRHGDVKPHHIVSHKLPGLHHPSAAERLSLGAVQGLVTTTPTLAPDDAPEDFSDERTGNDKGHTQRTKVQLETE
ncbi:hypothetical protein MMC29_005601 [Sticta canariensis]|nr:hypothetical protein [Sticta canariensis]